MFRRLAILLLSGTALLLTAPARAEPLDVRLLVSDAAPHYREFSAALDRGLAASNIRMTVMEPQDSGTAGAGLVIAVGMKAAELAIGGFSGPVLAVMVPRAGYEVLLESHAAHRHSEPVSAIYLDQPWSRQLNFIQAVLPEHGTVGLLYSPEAPVTLPRLPRGMSLNAQSVRSSENLFAALESVLANSDVLLVTPDSEIYSSSNVRNILLTSYRHKVPLIGISQAYVNAGALGALFSTPEQLAEQTARVVAAFARERRLPEPQYPASFSIALNQQVARSLGITLDFPEVIRRRMERAGEGRQ